MAFTPAPQETGSPVKALTEREVYYPGSEDLGPNEMRVVALGTGMPNARPKQAAACWLVELGNGDKFLFDCDTRMGNTDTRGLFLEVTEFPYEKVNSVIYQENGVIIRTIPAIHIYDGNWIGRLVLLIKN